MPNELRRRFHDTDFNQDQNVKISQPNLLGVTTSSIRTINSGHDCVVAGRSTSNWTPRAGLESRDAFTMTPHDVRS